MLPVFVNTCIMSATSEVNYAGLLTGSAAGMSVIRGSMPEHNLGIGASVETAFLKTSAERISNCHRSQRLVARESRSSDSGAELTSDPPRNIPQVFS